MELRLGVYNIQKDISFSRKRFFLSRKGWYNDVTNLPSLIKVCKKEFVKFPSTFLFDVTIAKISTTTKYHFPVLLILKNPKFHPKSAIKHDVMYY